MAWLGGQCCWLWVTLRLLSQERHTLVAGNASPRGIQDLLLADPELINCTKAAWLGSSPDCRRCRQEQERCGIRQCGKCQQEAQGREAAEEGVETER